jgi:hydrogenase expression/formation protein HypD
MGRIATAGYLEKLADYNGEQLTFMEVCGSHTMAIARSGLKSLLPKNIRLISGPGCPVCVTPVGYVDHALALAKKDNVIIATFGDMVRVPGSRTSNTDIAPSLIDARARGADIQIVYSPLDALALAKKAPSKEVVFLGVGFETTAPTLAAAILKAKRENIKNFTLLSAAKTIPEALELLAADPDIRLNGLLCPGHVSIILGSDTYLPLVEEFGIPCAIAGFEPEEIIRGVVALVGQTATGVPKVENCYPGAVKKNGNQRAREVMDRVFQRETSIWRGLGPIKKSGLSIRVELSEFDAAKRFTVSLPPPHEPKGCRCGDVLKGVISPSECGLFGKSCTPESPHGACMVSSEGSCAAHFTYQSGEPT